MEGAPKEKGLGPDGGEGAAATRAAAGKRHSPPKGRAEAPDAALAGAGAQVVALAEAGAVLAAVLAAAGAPGGADHGRRKRQDPRSNETGNVVLLGRTGPPRSSGKLWFPGK